MEGVSWTELYPNKINILIFIGYVTLFISQGILVTSSQESNNKYSYNTVAVVLLTELLKLIISTCLYVREHTFKSLVKTVIDRKDILGLYFVPASLYCLYNNLSFINLSAFDPTTYYLLLQFRVVITGILFQVIFKKYLNKRQWMSLLLLTVGCMVKQINFNIFGTNESANISKNLIGFDLSINAVFILIQTICSCLAGVYNEYLLKNKGPDVNIYVQNVFMYLDSIICNITILLLQGNIHEAITSNSIRSIFRLNVILIIIDNAAIGIITSFFLKYLNSILKTFASAIELLFTAVLCYIIFSIPIHLNTILAIGIVSLAVYLYSRNPVVNNSNISKSSSSIETRSLLNKAYENV